jgi:hypothetical protein
VIDRVFTAVEEGQVHFADAASLTSEDLGAAQQQVRTHVLRWFARAPALGAAARSPLMQVSHCNFPRVARRCASSPA